MSLGIRSGVNCTRENVRSSASATVLTSSVFARPGTPTSSACPPLEERRDEVVHDLVLSDDAAADLVEQRAPRASQLVQQLDVARLRGSLAVVRAGCATGVPGLGRPNSIEAGALR